MSLPEAIAEDDQRLVERALAGEREDAKRLFIALTPVIQARVARLLWRHRESGRVSRQDALDLTQDVIAALLADGGRILLGWDPARGLSLKNFVGLVAERHTLSTLRRRIPEFSDEPNDSTRVDFDWEETVEERLVASRELLQKLSSRLHKSLSPLGLEVFHRLYVEEQSVEEIQLECDLTPVAIYQWRSRLRRLARRTLLELQAPIPTMSASADSHEGST